MEIAVAHMLLRLAISKSSAELTVSSLACCRNTGIPYLWGDGHPGACAPPERRFVIEKSKDGEGCSQTPPTVISLGLACDRATAAAACMTKGSL